MGLHVGRVVVKHHDIEGNTVNVAARVTASSKPDRILLTRQASERLAEDLAALVQPWRTESLKGKTETFELFELNWRGAVDPQTTFGQAAGGPADRFKRLTLRCQGKACVLEAGGKALTFGRSNHNELVVDDPSTYVSGSHGRIEIYGGAMVLTDNSRNGIFIAFGEGRFFLVDKTVVLRGSGRMSLGRSPEQAEAVIAEFELE
jgi:hypothetical protein